MPRTPLFIAVCSIVPAVCAYALALACGLVLPAPAAVVAASFMVNLALLAGALAWVPDGAEKGTWAHLRGLGFNAWLIVSAFVGLWLYGVRIESPRIFAALAAITIAETSLLAAVNAVVLVCGGSGRAARTLCGLLLAISATAFFWTRPPILNAGSPERTSIWITGVMTATPAAGVAAAWYSESDAAFGARAEARRFDLVRAPQTYVVWIGSYEAVEYPEILPRGVSRWGLAAWLMCFSLPVLGACDFVKLRRFT
jgi:hypothetical protein